MSIRLRRKDEAKHTSIWAETGAGKTQQMLQRMLQVEELGEAAIVVDVDRQFAPLFYKSKRGDVLLDPGLADCPIWNIGAEFENALDATMLVNCMFPDIPNDQNKFFSEGSRDIVKEFLLRYRPSAHQLGRWLTEDELFWKKAEGTGVARIIGRDSPPQVAAFKGHLAIAGNPLVCMPEDTPEERARRKVFSFREWLKTRKGWIFITSRAEDAEGLNPLHRMWFALAMRITMGMGQPKHLSRVHFYADEVSDVADRNLVIGMRRLRKTGCPITIAGQNFGDLADKIGEHVARSVFSQAYTTIIGRTKEPRSAKLLEETVSINEYERVEESMSYGGGTRWGGMQRSYRINRVKEAAVSAAEIQNMEDLEFRVLQPSWVSTKLKIPYVDLEWRRQALVERKIDVTPVGVEPKPEPVPEPVAARNGKPKRRTKAAKSVADQIDRTIAEIRRGGDGLSRAES